MEISLPENPNHYHIIVGIISMVLALAYSYIMNTISTLIFWFFAIIGVILYVIGFKGLKDNYKLYKDITSKQKELLGEEIIIKRLEKEKLIRELRTISKV